ncbi:hypothetical protein K439DRAFT_1611983 [Ramaria rubella]|nr:hypothetical protein K439DRAFT_1611983 [Ramaria rubella]
MTAPTQDLDILFPLPSTPPSPLSPTARAGATHESAQALVRLLKENHVKFHCFFNDRGFHNHLSHHLFAAYHLGASSELLQAAFDLHADYQRIAYKSPSVVDINNWKTHLGNEDYYDSYLAFFSAELIGKGVDSVLQRFIFDNEANWGNTEQDKHPEMLTRLLAGLVHPFIYVGHGLEFGQLGMVAEGLAQAAVHSTPTSELLSRELLTQTSSSLSVATTLARKLSLAPTETPKSIHPISLLARILQDPRLAPETPTRDDIERYFEDTVKTRGQIIREYAQAWDADVSSPGAVSQRVEELAWVVALLYGVGGCRKDRFKADFFTFVTNLLPKRRLLAERTHYRMHLVTSSLFLPSILAHLNPNSQRTLLRSYFAVVLGYWVSQGRATLNIEGFYAATASNMVAPGVQPTPNREILTKDNLTPNAWYPLLQSTLMHPGEHLLKLQRALAHYASLYGTTPKGRFNNVELRDADKLDGTLFLRVAWLSMNRNGWMREGDQKGDWDFDGFFHE